MHDRRANRGDRLCLAPTTKERLPPFRKRSLQPRRRNFLGRKPFLRVSYYCYAKPAVDFIINYYNSRAAGARTSEKEGDKLLVHIIDDDESTRDSLTLLLRGENFEPKSYASAYDFLASADSTTRGCIVTDVRMPGMDGVELIARLKERGVDLPVIVVTGHGNVALAVRAMKEGATDFLEKPYSVGGLIDALRRASSNVPGGKGAESAEILAIGENLSKLSPREKEVLIKVIDGTPNKIIAFELGLSIRTVETHRAAIMTKMGAGSLAELVRACAARGLFGSPRRAESRVTAPPRPHAEE
jgi:two-component system, LuxR family, response regulator FixJ